jgi:phosphatidylglycerol:prolipoprotein diacylglycerol transferase
MYLLAFLFGMWAVPRLTKYRGFTLTADQRDVLVFDVFLGVLLGGRLGYVIFYGGSDYFSHPLKILALWEGGMSSHGGFIGVMIAILVFAYRQRVPLLALADVLVAPVAVGLALGRLGNLINGELYGTVATLPWGMYFPGVQGLRHPTQIYAVIKDLSIALVCFIHLRRSGLAGQARFGVTTAVFLLMYSVLRFWVEIYRDQSFVGTYMIGGLRLSEGQVLTIPVFLVGICLLAVISIRPRYQPTS